MHFSKKKFPKSLSVQKLLVPLQPQISKVVFAQMAESVDALVSNTSGAIHPGSIPGLGTRSCKFLLAALSFANTIAQMAESVDALVSNTSGATHPGSIPGLGTRSCKFLLAALFFCLIRKRASPSTSNQTQKPLNRQIC